MTHPTGGEEGKMFGQGRTYGSGPGFRSSGVPGGADGFGGVGVADLEAVAADEAAGGEELAVAGVQAVDHFDDFVPAFLGASAGI